MKRRLSVNRTVVNAMLPDIPADFNEKMLRLIAHPPREKEEPLMKRKLSIGLVLALVCLLLIAGALAVVLLGGKAVVDQVIAPKAGESAEDKFTHAEVQDILRVLDENGVKLSAELRERLERDPEGYYKEELMRAVAKTELGFYPSTWSLEDQKWYAELLVASGQMTGGETSCLVPGEGDLTVEEALALARKYIEAENGPQPDLENRDVYRRHMTYNSYMHNIYNAGRRWYIEYQALDITHDDYMLTMEQDGELISFNVFPGVSEKSDPLSIQDRFLAVYGGSYQIPAAFSPENWVAYHDALAAAAKAQDTTQWSRHMRALLEQEYALPQPGMLTRREAIAVAERALGNEASEASIRSDDADVPPYNADAAAGLSAVCLKDGDATVWKVVTGERVKSGGGLSGFVSVEIDAATGDVREVVHMGDSILWSARYVLTRIAPTPTPQPAVVVAQGKATPKPRPTSRPDGKPVQWYSDIAPDWYWKALDDVNYNGDTADTLMYGWEREYGDDRYFWPLEAKAIDGLWHDIPSDASVIPGLPAPEDIQQEAAIKLARERLREIAAGYPVAEKLDALQPALSFYYNTPQMGDHVWHIEFMDVTPKFAGVIRAYAYVNAQTGEVFEAWAEDVPIHVAPTPTPHPSAMPYMWKSDAAPAAFWEAISALATTQTEAAARIAAWEAEYGTDSKFWPPDAHAVHFLWTVGMTNDDASMPGIPAAGETTYEQAKEIGLAAFRKTVAGAMDDAAIDRLQIAATYWYDPDAQGAAKWSVEFWLPDEERSMGYAVIDPKTGEVLIAEYTPNSNG